jgi:hypothetical protein
MLPRADLNNGTRPLASIEAPAPAAASGDAREEIYHRLSRIALGKQLQADVISLLDDGTFLVKVADTPARMALPTGTRVGDKIPMTLVAREPRPTFLLTPQESSTPASLSPAGRLIDHVLQIAQQHGAPAAIVGDVPVLPVQPRDINPEKLADAMHDNLEFSGVFYESHLQQWLAGSRPQSLLAREPQAQGGKYVQHVVADPKSGQSGNPLLANSSVQDLATTTATDVDILIPQIAGTPEVAPEAARLISLQLNTLEQQQVQWQGELWPGQRMEWSVSQDRPDGTARGDGEQSWTSVVRFRLPTLGDIAATVRLAGGHVQVSVNTADAGTADALRQHAAVLADALAAAGSPLDSLLVKKDEPA